jgi:uncharacterized repeat protein (TIGR02543 family)
MFGKRIIKFAMILILLVCIFAMPGADFAVEDSAGKILVFSKQVDPRKNGELFRYFNPVMDVYTNHGYTVSKRYTTTETYEITSQDLEGTNLVMLLFSRIAYTQAEVDVLTEYLNKGGRIFLQSENGGWVGQENAIFSQLVEGLGGDFAITGGALFVNDKLGDSVLLEGITSLKSAYVAPMTCEGSVVPVLYDSKVGDVYKNIYMVDQAVGNGRITALSDVNIYSKSEQSQFERLMLNLVTDSIKNQRLVSLGQNPNAGFGGSPNVIITAPNKPLLSGEDYIFKITYQGQDGVAINKASIDVGDVVVIDENDHSMDIITAEITNEDDPTNIEVTYTARGGWVENANYTIALVNAEVEDMNGRKIGGNKSAASFAIRDTVSYTVTFDSNGGSPVDSQVVEEGGKLVYPTEPTRVGATFNQWCKDQDLTEAWSFGTDRIPNSNVTLYAKWDYVIDTDLDSISVVNHSLDKNFDPAVNEYAISGVSEDYIDIVANVKQDQYVTISVKGSPVLPGKTARVNLDNGINRIDIVVTAQDQVTSKTYTLMVTKLSNLTSLDSLKVDDLLVAPTIEGERVTYTANATNNGAVNVGVTMAKSSSIKINDTLVQSGQNLSVPLLVGMNEITVSVTAEDGIHSKSYTLWVYRQNSDATLSTLAVEGYDLNQAFDPSQVSYSVSGVKENFARVSASAQTGKGATVRINDVEVTTGAAVKIDLETGTNELDIIVTAEDGIHKNTYSLKIYRENNDASLSQLSVLGYSLNEDFNPAVESYSVSGVTDKTVELVAGVPSNHFGTIRLNGAEVTTGAAVKVDLENGANKVDVTVIAEDGLTKKTYTVIINRLSDVANLGSLRVAGCELEPSFDKHVTSYKIHTTSGSAVSVFVLAEDTGSRVDYGLHQVTSGGAVEIMTPVGLSLHEFKVTAENDYDTKTYVLAVDRDNNDPSPKNIEVLGDELLPAFKKDLYAYNVRNTSAATIDMRVTMSEYKTIRVNDQLVTSGEITGVPLAIGQNTIKVVTTAEDGIHKEAYSINVYRENDSARPEDIEVVSCNLLPAFNSNIDTYKVNSTNKESLDFKITIGDYKAIRVNGIATESGKIVFCIYWVSACCIYLSHNSVTIY